MKTIVSLLLTLSFHITALWAAESPAKVKIELGSIKFEMYEDSPDFESDSTTTLIPNLSDVDTSKEIPEELSGFHAISVSENEGCKVITTFKRELSRNYSQNWISKKMSDLEICSGEKYNIAGQFFTVKEVMNRMIKPVGKAGGERTRHQYSGLLNEGYGHYGYEQRPSTLVRLQDEAGRIFVTQIKNYRLIRHINEKQVVFGEGGDHDTGFIFGGWESLAKSNANRRAHESAQDACRKMNGKAGKVITATTTRPQYTGGGVHVGADTTLGCSFSRSK